MIPVLSESPPGRFHLLALGDVLDGQEDDPFPALRSLNLPGIEEHGAFANVREIVFHFVIVEARLLGKDGFQQFPQLGDVPLFVAQS